MADVKEYKCPACGGAMEFDTKSQQLKCPYCDSVVDINEYMAMEKAEEERAAKEAAEEAAKEAPDKETSEESTDKIQADKENASYTESWDSAGEGQWAEGETDNIKTYICQSCGGEIIADETTGATICPYCGNKMLIKDEFKGDRKPDCIIPFKFDKKQAKEAYLNHLKGKKLLPSVFKSENHIDEILGVYVPFWLFDAKTQGTAFYKAEKHRVWTSGKTEYTETEYYHVYRGGSMAFEGIPEDGSKKMDDTLMESVEPFDCKGAVPFSTAYLAGYVADRYDVTAEERIDRAKERVSASILEEFRDSVKGYDTVHLSDSNISDIQATYKYALYPVWILNTTWKGTNYVFAMNGQTGKMIGDLPVDSGKYSAYLLKWSVILSAIFYILVFIFHLIF